MFNLGDIISRSSISSCIFPGMQATTATRRPTGCRGKGQRSLYHSSMTTETILIKAISSRTVYLLCDTEIFFFSLRVLRWNQKSIFVRFSVKIVFKFCVSAINKVLSFCLNNLFCILWCSVKEGRDWKEKAALTSEEEKGDEQGGRMKKEITFKKGQRILRYRSAIHYFKLHFFMSSYEALWRPSL